MSRESISVVVPDRDRGKEISRVLGDLNHEIIIADLCAGIREAPGDVIVTVQGDHDLEAIPQMVRKVRDGAAVVSGSAGPGPRAYSAAFLREVEIESRADSHVPLELVVKAREMGRRVDGATARARGIRGLRWRVRGLWGGNLSTFTGGAPVGIFLLLVAVLWASMLIIPDTVATVESDASWQQVLAHAHARSLQFGKDVIFTQGPLGWIRSHIFHEDLYIAQVLLGIVLSLVLALWICRAGFGLRGPVRILFFFLACLCLMTEEVALFLAVALVSRGLCEEPGLPPWRAAVGVGFLALVSLTKFTFFILAVVAMVVIPGSMWRSHRRRAVWILGGFWASWMVLWVLAGQSPLNIVAYILTSLEMAAGYSEGMALVARPQTDLTTAALILVLWTAAMVLGAFRRPFRLPRAGVGAICLAIAFLLWKNSFVRHDMHAVGFFSMASIFPFLAWPRQDPIRWRTFARAGLSGSAILLAVTALLGVARSVGWNPGTVLGRAYQTIGANVGRLAEIRQHRQNLEMGRQSLAAHHALPGIAAIVKDGSVDMVTAWEQGVLLLNDFDYHPRPVFQSYAAYTPSLLQRNAAHFASSDSPEYVLMKLWTFDGRYPGMEDGMALKRILQHYVPVHHEKEYLLLRRVDGSGGNGDPQETVLVERTVRWGETIDLREHADRMLTLAVDIRYTLRGRARKTLLRAPRVNLVVRGPSGVTECRIIPGMSRTGFLIQPFLRTLPDLLLCYRSPSGWPMTARVDSLSIVLADPADAISFDTEVRVRIAEYPPSGICRGHGKVPLLDGEIRHQGSPGAGGYMLGPAGEWIVESHAPTTIAVPLPRDAGGLRTSYGILAAALQNGGPPDGVEFRISAEDAHGQRQVLWSRHLDPLRQAEHGEVQRVEIPLASVAEASHVLLETLPGPDDDGSWDMSYWSDFEFVPR